MAMDHRIYEITNFPRNINVQSSAIVQDIHTSEDTLPDCVKTVYPLAANTTTTTEGLYDTVASEERVVEAAASFMLKGGTKRTKSEREKQAGNKPSRASSLHQDTDPIYYVLEIDDHM